MEFVIANTHELIVHSRKIVSANNFWMRYSYNNNDIFMKYNKSIVNFSNKQHIQQPEGKAFVERYKLLKAHRSIKSCWEIINCPFGSAAE